MVYGSGDTTTTPTTTVHSYKTVEDFNDYSLKQKEIIMPSSTYVT